MRRHNGHSKDLCEGMPLDAWFNHDTFQHERVRELVPTDWPLYFHEAFLLVVARDPDLNCMGDYTMGWEM